MIETERGLQRKDIELSEVIGKVGNFETENARLHLTVDELLKRINEEKIIKEEKISGILVLQERIINLEQKLKTETEFCVDYKEKYNELYRSYVQLRKQSDELTIKN
jgi:ubiquitin